MRIGEEIVRRERIDSTMRLLDELARAGAAEGTIVLADVQDAGRGRAGRSWSGPRGGIYCSVLLRPPVSPDRLGPLPLMIGLSVAESVERVASVRAELKWPNDVQISGKKIAGILIQSRLNAKGIEFLNLGIGINVSQAAHLLPGGATTIAAESGNCSLHPNDVVPELWNALNRRYSDFVAAGGRPSLEPWRERATMLGQSVTVLRSGEPIDGRFEDVDVDGGMLLRLADGRVERIVEGDLVRGPRLRIPD